MSGLSSMQRSILKSVLYQILSVEQENPQWLKDGIAWMPQWMPKSKDKSEDKALENVYRASLCRSLARLEERGLITRIKGQKKARTVRILLTSEGRKVAEAITAY